MGNIKSRLLWAFVNLFAERGKCVKSFFEKLFKDDRQAFFSLAEKNLVNEKRTFIVTANPEIFMQAKEDESLSSLLLDSETTMIADGIGIVKGAEMLGISVCEKIPGVELAEFMLSACNKHKKRVFLLGAKKEVLNTLCLKIAEKYPSLILVGSCDGYVPDKDEVFEEIRLLKPDLILVALGVPAQEQLIYRHYKDFEKGIFIGVGGSFDVLSGMKARAPKLFLRLNLEWLYRIIREPARLKRFYKNNIKFIFCVKKLKKR